MSFRIPLRAIAGRGAHHGDVETLLRREAETGFELRVADPQQRQDGQQHQNRAEFVMGA